MYLIYTLCVCLFYFNMNLEIIENIEYQILKCEFIVYSWLNVKLIYLVEFIV